MLNLFLSVYCNVNGLFFKIHFQIFQCRCTEFVCWSYKWPQLPPATVLNLFICSNSFLVDSLGFPIYKITSNAVTSCNCAELVHLFEQPFSGFLRIFYNVICKHRFYSSFLVWRSFMFFSCLQCWIKGWKWIFLPQFLILGGKKGSWFLGFWFSGSSPFLLFWVFLSWRNV